MEASLLTTGRDVGQVSVGEAGHIFDADVASGREPGHEVRGDSQEDELEGRAGAPEEHSRAEEDSRAKADTSAETRGVGIGGVSAAVRLRGTESGGEHD